MRREWIPNARLGFNFRNSWMVLVDLVGIEPTTSSMPWKRAPSCATGPREKHQRCAGVRANSILAYWQLIVKPGRSLRHLYKTRNRARNRTACGIVHFAKAQET